MKERYLIIFKGIVQGVGFRYHIYHLAYELNLTGYVRNLYNGDVQVEVQGNKESVDEFIKEVLYGQKNSFIKIMDYSLKKISVDESDRNFRIDY